MEEKMSEPMILTYHAPTDLATREESFEIAVLNALTYFRQDFSPAPPPGFKMTPAQHACSSLAIIGYLGNKSVVILELAAPTSSLEARCILLTDYKDGHFEVVGAQHHDSEAVVEWLEWSEICSAQTNEQKNNCLVISWDELC